MFTHINLLYSQEEHVAVFECLDRFFSSSDTSLLSIDTIDVRVLVDNKPYAVAP